MLTLNLSASKNAERTTFVLKIFVAFNLENASFNIKLKLYIKYTVSNERRRSSISFPPWKMIRHQKLFRQRLFHFCKYVNHTLYTGRINKPRNKDILLSIAEAMVPRYRPWSGRHARNRWQFQEAYTPDRTSFLELWREPTAPCICMPTFKAVLQVTSWLNKRSRRLIHTRFNYQVFYINMIFIIKYKLINFKYIYY